MLQLTLQFDPLPPMRRLWMPLLLGWPTQFGLWRGTQAGIMCLVRGYTEDEQDDMGMTPPTHDGATPPADVKEATR